MRTLYVKTISGSHFKLEGDLEIRSDAFVFQVTDKDSKVIFPWVNVERIEIVDKEEQDETD